MTFFYFLLLLFISCFFFVAIVSFHILLKRFSSQFFHYEKFNGWYYTLISVRFRSSIATVYTNNNFVLVSEREHIVWVDMDDSVLFFHINRDPIERIHKWNWFYVEVNVFFFSFYFLLSRRRYVLVKLLNLSEVPFSDYIFLLFYLKQKITTLHSIFIVRLY